MKIKQFIIVAVILLAAKTNAQMKIFSGGNINIGSTTTPVTSSKVQIVGNATFLNANSSVTSAAHIRGNNSYSGASNPDFTWAGNDQTGLFHPNANIIGFSTYGSERMRLNNYGHLTINTTNDDGFITINSAGTRAASFSVTLTSDWQSPSITTYAERAASGHYEVKLNGTTKFYVSGGGWVYNVGGIYNASDKNLKDDIKAIDSAMAKVLKLNGVTYKLKAEKQNPNLFPNPQEYMGLIAQDVEKVAPQAVKIVHDGTKAVSYEMLVGLLIEALKEQNAKVAQLENDVNNCCVKSETKNNRINLNDGSNESYNGNSYIKQNSPNPFSKETSIEYFIAEKNVAASILVFDMNGKLLKTFRLEGNGKSSLNISANDFQPGMYYYSLIINNKEIDTKKMILTE